MPAVVDKEKCSGCKACIDACPSSAITVPEDVAIIDDANCIDCEACVNECPNQAIALK